ncbi:hypothetical protein ACIQKE_36330 [Streptomyces griseoviridis]
MLRLRLQIVHWPRPLLVLADTPRPRCPDCQGDGGIEYPYGDENGDYAGSHWDPCPCWTEQRWPLLPLPRRPRWLRRTAPDPWGRNGYSDEPPF